MPTTSHRTIRPRRRAFAKWWRRLGAGWTFCHWRPEVRPERIWASISVRLAPRIRAVCLMVRHGMPALKQAVVGGQYEYPKGLFFGGKGLQEGLQRYESFLAHRLASARQVLAIDVHTGLGKYGEDTLLVDAMQYAALRRRFGERVARSDPRESPAYQVTGALESMIFRVLRGAQVDFLRQEFGTYGPVKVLQALRQENRAHYYDDGRSGHPAKTVLREIFCPADESWRQSVLKRGSELLSQALAGLFGGEGRPRSGAGAGGDDGK